MTTTQKLTQLKLGLLMLAEKLGNVSEACKVMGYEHTFYRFEKLYEQVDELALQCVPYFSTYGSMSIPIEMKKEDGQLSNTYFFATNGSFTRLELTGTTAGDQYTYFDIIKKENGVRVDVKDSIYIGKGQTKTYEVQF